MSLSNSFWISLNRFTTRKSFGKFVSPSAMNGFVPIWPAVFRDCYLIKSGSFCLYTDYMLRNSSVLHLQGRENFLKACPVIYISDSSMLMQETVISFEEVMQTKLKVKLCISRFSTQSLYMTVKTCFSSKRFLL